MSFQIEQLHGKSKVRVGRVWREGNVHHFAEWSVNTMLESPMEHAYTRGDNKGMTATDTQKNTVYIVAQRMPTKCTVEQYATALAQHFVRTYPLVSKAKISVEQKAWTRAQQDGLPHDHGYILAGTELRTVHVEFDKSGRLEVTAGVKDLTMLKTTQSGYTGFLRDSATALPESTDRVMASSVTCNWRYSSQPLDYDAAFNTAKKAMMDGFYGPAKGGVYSPSVQFTLYAIAQNIMDRIPQTEWVWANMPNIHLLPASPPGGTPFDNDVYVATSEPHGNIEARICRPSAKL